MKNIPLFCVAMLTMLSCNSKGTTSQENQNDNVVEQQTVEQQTIESEPQNVETIDSKFLITNTSIGLFSQNSNWSEDYQTYGYNKGNSEECVDACCFGTTVFWKSNESKENPSIVLYNKYFEDEQTADSIKMDYDAYSTVYSSRNDLFFVGSDNCSDWYYKNLITACAVYSSDFKTQENIGVGSGVEDFLKAFDKAYITIGWIEEDADAIQLSTDKYPNLAFIVNSELFNVDWVPADKDRIGGEESNKFVLHNTACFIGNAKIVKITLK